MAGDALRLPFADESFDAVTISFGLRNVADVDLALRELARVTRRGGTLVVCEFSRPTLAPFRWVYLNYLMRVLPWVARRVASNADAYVYLAESIRSWPAQDALARQITAAGWRSTRWRNLTGGIVALHRATKPRTTPSGIDEARRRRAGGQRTGRQRVRRRRSRRTGCEHGRGAERELNQPRDADTPAVPPGFDDQCWRIVTGGGVRHDHATH